MVMIRWWSVIIIIIGVVYSSCVFADLATRYVDHERAVDLLPFMRVLGHEGFSVHAVLNYSASYHPERTAEVMRRLIGNVVPNGHDKSLFAFLLLVDGRDWVGLLQQIASVHALAWGHPIVAVFTTTMSDDHVNHLELLSHVSIHRFHSNDISRELFSFTRSKTVLYLPYHRWLSTDQFCAFDQHAPPFITPTTVLDSLSSLMALGSHPLLQVVTTEPQSVEMQQRLYGNTLECILHIQLPHPAPGPVPLKGLSLPSVTSPSKGVAPLLGTSPLKGAKSRICLAISTFNSAHDSPEAFSLNTVVLPSLASVLGPGSLAAADFYIYLGIQPGDSWDDKAWRERALAAGTIAIQGKADFRVFRYPLVGRLVDIAAKYNMLILQAHADGCDYIYQYSDDAMFLPSSQDWPLVMLADFKLRHNFGVWGLSDTNNPTTMTLGATSRAHIDLQGWFWPPILKNWYADNYIQSVYGPEFSPHYSHMNFHNTQTYGQRYNQCDHELEMWLSIVISRARALTWSITALPEWTPYFTNLLRDGIATFLKRYTNAHLTSASASAPVGAMCVEKLAFRTVRVPPGSSPLEVIVVATKHAFDSAFSHMDHLHTIIDHAALAVA